MVHDLAELLGNEDRSGHQHATWRLLEINAEQELSLNGVSIAGDVKKHYDVQREEVKKNPRSELVLNFPFVAQNWPTANEVRSTAISDFIKLNASRIGVGRLAQLLLLRAQQCCWNFTFKADTRGTTDMGVIIKAYANLINPPSAAPENQLTQLLRPG